MKSDQPFRTWSDAEMAALTAAWLAGEHTMDIAAKVGRTRPACLAMAKKMKLPRRDHNGNRRMASMGRPIASGSTRMRPELPSQAAAWAGVQFDDAAVRSEGMLRGLPPLNHSSQTSCAAVAAGI